MTTTESVASITASEVDQILAAIAEMLGGVKVATEFTIEDYPIGGTNRGLCKLGVEHKSGKGYRTVRETTNKHGTWCKPKKSTYQWGRIYVVSGLLGTQVDYGDQRLAELAGAEKAEDGKIAFHHDAAWLRLSANLWNGWQSVYIQYANGDSVLLARVPGGYCKPKDDHPDFPAWERFVESLGNLAADIDAELGIEASS